MNYKLKETEQQIQEQKIKLTEESCGAPELLCATSLSLSLVASQEQMVTKPKNKQRELITIHDIEILKI